LKKLRIAALTGFPAALVAAACGSILDINDRTPDDQIEGGPNPGTDGNTDGGPNGTDGASILEPAEASIPPLVGSKCEPSCEVASGKCVDRGASGRICEFTCDGTCRVNCPPGNDCELKCAKDKNSCKDSTCLGGRSCTFLCTAEASCNTVNCQGDLCRFDCQAKDSCKNPTGFATTGCFIDCRGETTCGGDKSSSCLGTGTMQINCTGKGETCKDKSFCAPVTGQTCTINCGVKDCEPFCCDTDAGGGCKFEGNIDNAKNCK
jgi:hypothetical protein